MPRHRSVRLVYQKKTTITNIKVVAKSFKFIFFLSRAHFLCSTPGSHRRYDKYDRDLSRRVVKKYKYFDAIIHFKFTYLLFRLQLLSQIISKQPCRIKVDMAAATMPAVFFCCHTTNVIAIDCPHEVP